MTVLKRCVRWNGCRMGEGRQVPTAIDAVQAGKLPPPGVCVRDMCYGAEVRDSGFCEPCLVYLREGAA